jgi:hypothetical protein
MLDFWKFVTEERVKERVIPFNSYIILVKKEAFFLCLNKSITTKKYNSQVSKASFNYLFFI